MPDERSRSRGRPEKSQGRPAFEDPFDVRSAHLSKGNNLTNRSQLTDRQREQLDELSKGKVSYLLKLVKDEERKRKQSRSKDKKL